MNIRLITSTILLVAAMCCNVMVNAAGINFNHNKWQEIVQKAKDENKLIFIDFYTQWCGPCFNMANTVFNQPEVGEFYNKNFINAKIDAENGEGVELARKYNIRSYPSYVFINPSTLDVVHFSSSRQSAEQFISTGEAALTPTRQSIFLLNEYNNGNRSKELLINYIDYNFSIYHRDEVSKAFGELIDGGAKLTDKDVWDIFDRCINGMNNKYIHEISDNYTQFCELFGKNVVDAKLAKETTYGDLSVLDKMCDFDGKSFNRQMIIINQQLRDKKYDEASLNIDNMIADASVDQQKLIERLKFIARISSKNFDEYPSMWLNKCIGYLQYIAYNQTDRDDAYIHQEYAAALEEVLRRNDDKSQIPDCLKSIPEYGKKSYSMRPDALKTKPKK